MTTTTARGTVYFIGAGPGDPELLTVRGRRLIERCPVCLYAGSLVPAAVVACAYCANATPGVIARPAANTAAATYLPMDTFIEQLLQKA